MPKRLILKLSGELFRSEEIALDLNKTKAVAEEIIKLKKDYEIGIVFGGGNIFRGRDVSDVKLNMGTAHYIGMTATLVNALALKSIFDLLGVASRVISSLNFSEVIGISNKFDLNRYFTSGEIIIFAGGTGNPFVTTDTAAVIHALEIKAEFILKGTKVTGVYDLNPNLHPQATQYKKLSYQAYLQIPAATILDKVAATMAEEHHLPIYIFKWGKDMLKKAAKFKANGTLIN
ncbi:UMP kinase [Candidatus Kuenenbacteria bacterium CG_4_9_14_3_um_filter_39_14]|uniref:Uridylate kinase n=6 Tax=Candidatus Kueneniibacteriota TaxID=1752740 RepID=A0A2M7ILP9_9BACT|nr:UMP kinase [Candidatus Kuenenbacteria bacterium]OIP56254.1 MAG: hypothetical protein AUK13_01435 [Candidatus Kuenenbacteria bacterium CG2_30_39_24]PIP75882.1 MAG: UMP kinase [Candidatus Kuenenbacteria bacterium CG22_combo_CG10-13_8_21_14_all_39_9]PIR80837.1 MAG: UMP kinase [Candidatus Kuenenbacteria bacterium CG10_big_fil_rev_8_21_14_0_10_39_14]PIW95789.1 MAG: UMP kinase [Candidatus Kuenenbacteria bacterium CG_4_8_14_3_um_filter_39_15]PIX92079.1 MAG: UMP kinase [Candidatus Kuenenbacteria ba